MALQAEVDSESESVLETVLARAFPGSPLPALTPILGGKSGASVFGFSVLGAEYVLKQRRAAGDVEAAAREAHCQRIAADLGVAPRLHYADEESGITILERIVPLPPPASEEARSQRLVQIAKALRTLHDGPRFPKGRSAIDFARLVDGTLRANAKSGVPVDLVATLHELDRLTLRFQEEATCHRDPNPGNVLVAEEGVFFVDWDSAALGDPFFDLAELGVFALPTDEGRRALLHAYLGRSATAGEEARARAARVMALGFYAVGAVWLAGMADLPLPGAGSALPLLEMMQAMGRTRGAVSPEIVAGSLLGAMRSEAASHEYRAAKRRLSE